MQLYLPQDCAGPHNAKVSASLQIDVRSRNGGVPAWNYIEGGERIPPYSEIHTFIGAKNEETWLIAAHNFTRQVLPKTSTGTM
jgi:hypothetical protein